MSAAPFDIDLVVDRLAPLVAAGTLRKIGYRTDYAAVRALQDFPAPCAYVLLARERGLEAKGGSDFPGEQSQLGQIVPVNFGVVLVARNQRLQEGDELRDALSDLIAATRNRLLGWTPDLPAARACQLAQGDLTDYDHATAVWKDVWFTQHFIQPEISA